jgi:diguanylate cyclase (GGDEF)-like protein
MSNTAMTGDMDDLVKLSFFVDIGKGIIQAKTIDETLQKIMHHIGEIFLPLNWSILLKSAETGDLTFTLVVGQNAAKLRGLKLPDGEGIAGWVAETGEPLIVSDVAKDPRFSTRVDKYTGFTTHSIVAVPLKANDKVYGVIELINKLSGQPFTPFDLKVLTTIADFAALAIERAYYSRALKRMATIDSLTGAQNRGSFERIYSRELEMCRRYDLLLSLLMVDVDDFKKINDTFGHLVGDKVLKDLVELLMGCVRKVDTVFRYGGDEFVVLMPNTSKEQAQRVRKRILERIEYQNSLSSEVKYKVSIGLHSVDPNNDDEILQLLDTDLYRQKDRKFATSIDQVDQHLEDMLQEERSKLRPQGKHRRG